MDEATPLAARHHPRQVKGSHIVVPKLFDHPFAYIFQGADGRIVFAIPYEGDYTLIGTTEMDYSGDLATPAIAGAGDRVPARHGEPLLLERPARKDVAWTLRGAATAARGPEGPRHQRHARLRARPRHEGAPLLSIYGGKLTTYRKLAEDVLDLLAPALGCRSALDRAAPLPGGDLPGADFDAFLASSARASLDARGTAAPLCARLRFACRADPRGATSRTELGEEVLPDLHEREIDYLRREEWAVTAEDILYRRSKLALHVPDGSASAWTSGSPPSVASGPARRHAM